MKNESYNNPGRAYEAYGVFFETLANQNRLRIINALRQGERNVTQIVAKTGLEQTCVSHCLTRLERCGFVSARRDGKYRVYALNEATILPLMKLIDSHTRAYCIHLIDAPAHMHASGAHAKQR